MAQNETEIRISAPGKVILHGEHAVVYGKAAIAAALNLRCHLTLKTTADSTITLDLPDVDMHKQFSVTSVQTKLPDIVKAGSIQDPFPASDEVIAKLNAFIGADASNTESRSLAVTAFLYIFYSIFKSKSELPSLSISMKSDLPVGAGLGSSAAFSVSLAAALLQFAGHIKSEKSEDGLMSWTSSDKDLINKWAFIGEKVIHGRPSGIDNSISTFGCALKFQNGQITHINNMPALSVMLVNTKVPRSTMVLVGGVRQKYNMYQEIFDPVFCAVEAITERAQSVYKTLQEDPQADYKTLGDLIDFNHQLLNIMGVSHPTLDKIVMVAKKYGLHAKLTGAGGGGCAFLLTPPDTEDSLLQAVKEELDGLGYETWLKTTVCGHGVLHHL